MSTQQTLSFNELKISNTPLALSNDGVKSIHISKLTNDSTLSCDSMFKRFDSLESLVIDELTIDEPNLDASRLFANIPNIEQITIKKGFINVMCCDELFGFNPRLNKIEINLKFGESVKSARKLFIDCHNLSPTTIYKLNLSSFKPIDMSDMFEHCEHETTLENLFQPTTEQPKRTIQQLPVIHHPIDEVKTKIDDMSKRISSMYLISNTQRHDEYDQLWMLMNDLTKNQNESSTQRHDEYDQLWMMIDEIRKRQDELDDLRHQEYTQLWMMMNEIRKRQDEQTEHLERMIKTLIDEQNQNQTCKTLIDEQTQNQIDNSNQTSQSTTEPIFNRARAFSSAFNIVKEAYEYEHGMPLFDNVYKTFIANNSCYTYPIHEAGQIVYFVTSSYMKCKQLGSTPNRDIMYWNYLNTYHLSGDEW